MAYTADWKEEGPGVFVITPKGIGAVRLVGLVFGAPGAWLLYQFAGGVLHPDEMTIFGWILLPVMAAVFLVPAWIILVGRKRTRVDATLRQATEEFDLLVYTRRKTTTIPRDAHVMLRYEQQGKSTLFAAHVYLVPGATPILLAIFTDKAGALAFAHKVAATLGADVQDRCVEHGEVTAGGVVVDRLGPEDAD